MIYYHLTVDLIYLPRVNTVEGLTKSHIDKWRWNVDDKGRVNYQIIKQEFIKILMIYFG